MASDAFHRLLRTSTWTALAEVGPDEALLRVNPAFALQVERPAEALLGTPFTDHLATPDAERFRAWMAGERLPVEPVLVNLVSGRGVPFTLRCLVEPTVAGMLLVGEPTTESDRPAAEEIMRVNNELATMARERGRRERELEKLRARLEAALEELKTSYWHLQIFVSHGYCPECAAAYFRYHGLGAPEP